jgi:hypothetical protein
MVKYYKDSKAKKISTDDSSDVSFHTALKYASQKHKIKRTKRKAKAK